MGKITSAALLSSMRPEAARERNRCFREDFGLPHLYFAQHAAFPMALTSDLLYCLWANFQRDIDDNQLHIPWIAVADLLLSPLCEEVGHELYEMDVMIRAELLGALKTHPNFGQRRINELSNFLLYYVRRHLQSNNPGIHDLAQAQRWTALAYIQPSRAARELAEALKKLDFNSRAEQIRIVSLMETLDKLADPLAALEGFTPLLTYGRGIEQLARGDVEAARTRLSDGKGTVQIEQAIGIRLPTLEQLLGANRSEVTPAAPTRLEAVKMTVEPKLQVEPKTKNTAAPADSRQAIRKGYVSGETILLIRNGENQSDVGMSTLDPHIVELTEKGWEQAEAIAQFLLAAQLIPEFIVTSSYLHTKQTAEPTKLAFPHVPEEEWPVQEFTYLSSFHEQRSTIQDRRPMVESYWAVSDPSYVDGTGSESFEQFIARVRDVKERLEQINHGMIALFSHEQFMNAFRWLSQNDPAELSPEAMKRFRTFLDENPIPNGTIVVAKYHRGFADWNYEYITAHLIASKGSNEELK